MANQALASLSNCISATFNGLTASIIVASKAAPVLVGKAAKTLDNALSMAEDALYDEKTVQESNDRVKEWLESLQ